MLFNISIFGLGFSFLQIIMKIKHETEEKMKGISPEKKKEKKSSK
jgi:hypothetical protein